MKARFLFVVVILMMLTLTACSTGTPGNPTAKDILKDNSDADILQYDGLIYMRHEYRDYLPDYKDAVKYEELGEIKEMINSYSGFKDFSASKLPIGSKVFSTTNGQFNFLLIIELEGEEVVYTVLLEG